MPNIIYELVGNYLAIELAKALQEVLRQSSRTVADSELLGHLSAWIAQAEVE